jgi:hypothetical protein
MVPVANASHQQVKVPPHQTGEGNNDVEDEIANPHPQDRIAPTNGFDRAPFDAPGLILEAFYETNYWQFDVDYNNVLRELVEGSGTGTWSDVIYPGLGYFNAWWGWWEDKGSGHQANDQDLGDAAGVAGSDTKNDAIDDAHDNRDRWDGDPNHGEWEEFLWRGDNQFAPDHPFTTNPDREPGGQVQFPGDSMKLFFSPGSQYTAPFFGDFEDAGPIFGPRPGILLDEKDNPREPEWSYSDRTSYGAYALEAGPSGVPQFGGWVSENGWMHFQYDTSLVMSAKAVSSVNPDPATTPGLFDPLDSANATDVDVYTALHPALEDAYRTTVWDPGDRQSNVGEETLGWDEGIKQAAKEEFSERSTNIYSTTSSTWNQLVAPASEGQGNADDNAGFRPQAHEPNHPDDDYNGHATHDSATAYGGVDQSSYYRPGGQDWDPSNPNAGTQTYNGYDGDEQLWFDMQAGFGQPLLLIALSLEGNGNFHTAPNTDGEASDQGDDNTALPSMMWFTGNLGTWLDHTDDTFVGDLDEEGRSTSSQAPFNDGNVDDPNDYGDNPNSGTDDATPFEWSGVDSATVDITVKPMTDDGRWGTTGVYVYSDSGGQFNPYDDVVADITGGVLFSDQDNYDGSNGRFSRHVQEGPIQLSASFNSQDGAQGATGSWTGDEYLVLPTGSANYDIRLETTATLRSDIPVQGGRTIPADTTIQDVDVVNSWN